MKADHQCILIYNALASMPRGKRYVDYAVKRVDEEKQIILTIMKRLYGKSIALQIEQVYLQAWFVTDTLKNQVWQVDNGLLIYYKQMIDTTKMGFKVMKKAQENVEKMKNTSENNQGDFPDYITISSASDKSEKNVQSTGEEMDVPDFNSLPSVSDIEKINLDTLEWPQALENYTQNSEDIVISEETKESAYSPSDSIIQRAFDSKSTSESLTELEEMIFGSKEAPSP